MDRNPKQFVNQNKDNESHVPSAADDYEREKDDPLSIKNSSFTLIGLILAAFTILLPSISILLERPLLEDNEIGNYQLLEKDGY